MENETEVKNEKINQPKKNKWKIAFLVLLGLLIGIDAFIFFRISQTRESNNLTKENVAELAGTQVISLESNKEKVNALIDFYLQEFQKDSEIKYDFYLEEEAMLNGTFQVLGYPIQFYLYFDPYVTEDGNIQLKANSLSLGVLELSIADILSFIQKEYKLPDWVEVNPEKSFILLRLDKFDINKGLFVRAEQINLVDDIIQFSVYLPDEIK